MILFSHANSAHAKICDLGMLYVHERNGEISPDNAISKTIRQFGTIRYMAPEVLRNEKNLSTKVRFKKHLKMI